MEHMKDIVVVLAGTGILSKVAIEWNISRKEKKSPVNSGGNGKGPYATQADLMKHSVECPAILKEKIEGYNKSLTQQMNFNHKETMETFTELKVAIAKLDVEIGK